MLANVTTTRRSLLGRIVLGSVWVAAMGRPGFVKASLRFEGHPGLRFAPDHVRTTLPHHREAARLGAAYLRTAPQDYDLAYLLNGLTSQDPKIAFYVNARDVDMVRPLVHRRITIDFERGDVVEVDGWVMSSTEVRLAAVAHIVGIMPTA
jgi:hypothetical protein